jgi:hypothetical protein
VIQLGDNDQGGQHVLVTTADCIPGPNIYRIDKVTPTPSCSPYLANEDRTMFACMTPLTR